MRFLRSNTAVLITVGPFYDRSDGVTIETALTITNERITLTADTDNNSAPTNILDNITGATSGTSNDLNYIANNDAGMMQLELAAADVNRVGRMFLSITDAANHVPVFHEFFVLPATIYDWLTGVTANLSTNVAAINSVSTSSVDTVNAKIGTSVSPQFAGNFMQIDVQGWDGTFVSASQTAGVPDVNIIAVNNISTSAVTAVASSPNALADAFLDRADAIETGITPRGAMRIGVAADAGKTNGMASAGTAHLRDVADTKNRVTATVDGSGNRTATTVDTA